MNLSNFKEDQLKQESGSPFYIGEDNEYICVRRLGTAESSKQIEDIKKALYGFAPKDIDHNAVMGHWLAEHGVTGWDGVQHGETGEDLDFNKQNAIGVFTNPAYFQSLNALLLTHASNYANYLHDETNEDIEQVKKQ